MLIHFNSKYLIVAALSLGLAACTGSDDEPTATHNTPYITFGLGAGLDVWQSQVTGRAALDTPECEIQQSMGVFGFNNAVSGKDAGAVFANTQVFNKDGELIRHENFPNVTGYSWPEENNWPYNPVKYWNNGADYIFTAYAPYSPTDVSVNDSTYIGFTTLQWNNISSISASDYVIANNRVACKATSSENPTVQLNLKHLMSRLRFCFKLGDAYADLRTIVLKKMEVDYSDSRKMTLTVNYPAIGSSDAPTFHWDRLDPGTGETHVALQNEPGVESIRLTKDATDYQALASIYYEPGDPLNLFNIKVTYDVYDSHDKLLRQNDTSLSAVAMWRTLEAGKYYDVKIIVEPSYLYILSDQEPDTDGGLVIP